MSEDLRLSQIPRPGTTLLGKYQLERVLGSGGMGAVVLAQHLQLAQDVAIKFLLPRALEDASNIARFLREARAAASLKSEHVARIIDVGELDTGAPYMVMEYLKGQDLGAVLEERGFLPVHEAVDYVLQACEAIAEAHSLGIVHRDLKPENLFLTRGVDGSAHIKVLDFGIAKLTSPEADDSKITVTGSVMGSPLYMSPEQVRSSKHVDARSDVWSLGVILHELISGRTPFESTSVSALCAMIVADSPMRLREVRPDLPEEIEAIVLECLKKNPDERMSDVGALGEALRPFAPRSSGVSLDRILKLSAGLGDTRRSDRPRASDRPETAATHPGEVIASRAALPSAVLHTPHAVAADSHPGSTSPALLSAVAIAAIALGVAGTFVFQRRATPGATATPVVEALGSPHVVAPPQTAPSREPSVSVAAPIVTPSAAIAESAAPAAPEKTRAPKNSRPSRGAARASGTPNLPSSMASSLKPASKPDEEAPSDPLNERK